MMTTADINLYNLTFRPRRLVLDARRALLLWLLGVLAVLAWATVATGPAGDHAWTRMSGELAAMQQGQLVNLTREVEQRAVQAESERKRLVALAAMLARTTTALNDWPGQNGLDHAQMLRSLSRTAHPSLWITGLHLSGDPEVIELRGQMLDASVLPGYLRSLNDEPVFRGRHFEQLGIRTVRHASGIDVAEFELRSDARPIDPRAQTK